MISMMSGKSLKLSASYLREQYLVFLMMLEMEGGDLINTSKCSY